MLLMSSSTLKIGTPTASFTVRNVDPESGIVVPIATLPPDSKIGETVSPIVVGDMNFTIVLVVPPTATEAPLLPELPLIPLDPDVPAKTVLFFTVVPSNIK